MLPGKTQGFTAQTQSAQRSQGQCKMPDIAKFRMRRFARKYARATMHLPPEPWTSRQKIRHPESRTEISSLLVQCMYYIDSQARYVRSAAVHPSSLHSLRLCGEANFVLVESLDILRRQHPLRGADHRSGARNAWPVVAQAPDAAPVNQPR